jgi:exodeoxyribonuclease V beta subunit
MSPRTDHAAAVADDPYLALDLDGVRLIEASAGTGKTYTLATLVLRLVVERDLRLARVLVVTYTEAATQELRARLRKRLQLAARIADELAADADVASADDGPEAASTRRLLLRRLRDEDANALRARLRRAAAEIDLAAVSTIHGFCARVLAEHALQTGQAFEPAELIGSERALHDELADDLWRRHGADARDAELLATLWPEPDALARDLDALLRVPVLMPPPPPATPDPIDALRAAAAALRDAFGAHGDRARAQLDAAIAGKTLNGNSYRPALVDALWHALARWATGDGLGDIEARLDRLTPDLLALRTNKGRQSHTPQSPLFDAIARYLDALRARAAWLRDASLAFLHRLRDDARARLAERKRVLRVRSYDDLIDGVAAALDGDDGAALAEALRAQYAVALVDEFQDTDARQWSIFRRVFGGGDAALFLIGDPKQAIYGFRGGDVDAYLAARDVAAPAPPLTRNFRSRPGLLRALETLYARAGEHAFVDARIRFQTIAPGRGEDDGPPTPALTLRLLPAPDDGATRLADDSRKVAADACAVAIHGVLRDARAGIATLQGAPVRPADIAVLVRDYREAAHIQAALAAVGVATVAAGRQSLFQTEQAQEVLTLLEALLQPADDARLRAALATVFLGRSGADIARMDEDDAWRGAEHLAAVAWRERWQRHGPLALLSDLCAAHAERLLARADGERRLTNLLQLGELLQQAAAAALGLAGLVDWLRLRIVEADPNDEAQLLRLESDAQRVQILTLHGSKGLEFQLVYLPFAGIGRGDRTPTRHCTISDSGGRVLYWKIDGDPRWDDAVAQWHAERRAEDARLLYVGLTRAGHAVWLAWSAFHRADATALKTLLDDPHALPAHPDIHVDAAPLAALPAPLPPLPAAAVPDARRVARVLSRDWWVHSFTQLTGEAARIADADRGADDEPDAPPGFDGVAFDGDGVDPRFDAAFDRRFGGSRFGNVLHDALERVDFAAWRDGDAALPPTQALALGDALRRGGYAEADIAPGLAALTPLVARTLGAALPEGTRLCDLPPQARRAEMEFHFSLGAVSVDALLALLHAHGWLRDRHGFGARRRLEGLMTGKIDLVYTHGGRYYLLDYKSNRLPAYDPAAIARAMDDSEYTLQALIYTLALHRWLRFRLGAAYDYARDFGGVRYLFCRGLDPAAPANGLYAQAPAAALIDALDTMFAAPSGGGDAP